MNDTAIREDEFIKALLAKLPSGAGAHFSDDQLVALKVGLGGRAWGRHAIDIRWTLRVWRWHYYFVFLAGRNRRELTRQEKAVARLAMATALAIFLTLSTLFGLLLIYLAKSALGIDLIPGYSFGIWSWFRDVF